MSLKEAQDVEKCLESTVCRCLSLAGHRHKTLQMLRPGELKSTYGPPPALGMVLQRKRARFLLEMGRLSAFCARLGTLPLIPGAALQAVLPCCADRTRADTGRQSRTQDNQPETRTGQSAPPRCEVGCPFKVLDQTAELPACRVRLALDGASGSGSNALVLSKIFASTRNRNQNV